MTLYGKIILTDAWGQEHTLVPRSDGGECFRLFLAYGGEAKSFMFTLQDIDLSYKGWLTKGCKVRFYADASDPPTTLVLTGQVEGVLRKQQNSVSLRLTVTGRERAYIRMLERVVSEAYLATAPSTILLDLLRLYAPYPDDTVLALSFREGAGASTQDESPVGAVFAISGAAWSALGKYGNCLSFDGVGDTVESSGTASSRLTDKGTLMCWFKSGGARVDYAALVAKAEGGLTTDIDYMLYNPNSDVFTGLISDGLSTNSISKAFDFSDTDWHFAVFRWDGDYLYLSIDNVEADPVAQTISAQSTDHHLRIGYYDVPCWSGLIDEVRVWNRCLTSQEILDCYTHGYLHYIHPNVDTAIDEIVFNYKKLKDCIDLLAKVSSSTYNWTPTEVLRFDVGTTVDSTIDYTDTDIAPEPSALASLIPIKNKVILIGGMRNEQDQSELGVDSHVHSSAYWYAQDFIPTRTDLSQISLYLSRIGVVGANLECGIYTNNPSTNLPKEQLAGFSFDEEYIDTAAAWKPSECKASLIIGERYWIVLKKVGANTTHDYQWYNDGHNTHTHAYSADGITWTETASSYHLAHKTYYPVRIVASKEDAAYKDTYLWRETVERDDTIVDRTSAQAYVATRLSQLTSEIPELGDLNIIDPAAIPAENSYVSVAFVGIDVAADYDVKSAQISWRGGHVGTKDMTLVMGSHAQALAEFIADLKLNVDRLNASDLGVGTIIDVLRTLADTFTLTVAETLSSAESGALTDYIDEHFADFDDWTGIIGTWALYSNTARCTSTSTGSDFLCLYDGAYETTLPTDYYCSFKAKTTLVAGTRLGIWFRAALGGPTYYVVEMGPYYDYVRVRKCVSGVYTTLSTVYNTPYPQNKDIWYTLRFYQRDSGASWKCTVWLDGIQVIDYTEAVRSINGTGKLYLSHRNYASGGYSQWDDIHVWTEA